MLTWVLGSCLAIGGPLDEALTEFNAHAAYPLPALDADQLATLESGEVLRLIEREEGLAGRAIALLVTEHSAEALWVASLDPHLTVDPDLTEVRLTQGPRELWYGYYDLPYPFADRHWMVESWNNRALATATGGRAWEHAWTLASQHMPMARAAVLGGRVPGVDQDLMDKAVETPDNTGAWLVITLSDGRTVLGYHARSTVGGAVPDWLVLKLVNGRLQALLERVSERCTGLVAEHYTAAHADIESGDGTPLTWRP